MDGNLDILKELKWIKNELEHLQQDTVTPKKMKKLHNSLETCIELVEKDPINPDGFSNIFKAVASTLHNIYTGDTSNKVLMSVKQINKKINSFNKNSDSQKQQTIKQSQAAKEINQASSHSYSDDSVDGRKHKFRINVNIECESDLSSIFQNNLQINNEKLKSGETHVQNSAPNIGGQQKSFAVSTQVKKKTESVVNNPLVCSSTNNSDVEQEWWRRPDGDIDTVVREYKNKFATCRKDTEIRKKFEDLTNNLQKYLNAKGLSKRREYTGSIYEKLNICGQEVFELDVMFVMSKPEFKTVNVSDGYCTIVPKDSFFEFRNDHGNLDPTLYIRNFTSMITKFLKENNDDEEIKLRGHGVACQLDIIKSKNIWFQVDLVPTLDIGGQLLVPKPPEDAKDWWRVSYSLDEKKKINSLDCVNECRKDCIRITKAFFKLHTSGLFKPFTSYCIKTVAFHKGRSDEVTWQDKDLGRCLLFFWKCIHEYLVENKLPHFFVPSINILGKIDTKNTKNMADALGNKIKSKASFLKALNKPLDKL